MDIMKKGFWGSLNYSPYSACDQGMRFSVSFLGSFTTTHANIVLVPFLLCFYQVSLALAHLFGMFFRY